MAAINNKCFEDECICATCKKTCSNETHGKTMEEHCAECKNKITCLDRQVMTKSDIAYYKKKFREQ